MPSIIPAILNWKGLDPDVSLIEGVTPAPKLEYLVALNTLAQGACTQPYAMTGLAFFMERGSDQKTFGQQMVNVATRHMRPLVARGDGSLKSGATDVCSIFATTSGLVVAADEIKIPSPFSGGSEAWPPSTGSVTVVGSAEVYEAAPVAAMDRLMESPTAASLSGAVREQLEVTRGFGLTAVPTMVEDLGSI